MNWYLVWFFISYFGQSHCNYSYFEQNVVKLVDFVDTIDWIDLDNDLILEGGAKVQSRKRSQQLLLYKDASAKLSVKNDFKYLLLKSSCTRNSKMFEITLDSNSGGKPLLYSSCINSTWTFLLNKKSRGTLTMKSNYPKEITVHKLGTGEVTEEKTLGVLQESGKIRLEELGTFSRPQVLVALLGLRGSGKSTIASLLSGNEKMFLQGRRSTKTTTLGIDISPIISTNEYVPAIYNALKNGFDNSGSPFPLVFTDSEGMGVRGDSIDFVSTIPPLLFSNVIIWVTTDSLRADEELTKLNRYLNLANKIQDESGELCTDFMGGRLVVIVNKMQGYESDEELTDELLEEEFESETQTATNRNSIRKKLKQCFKSIQVVGFPYLYLPRTDEYLKYTSLKGEGSDRFKESLTKIIKLILNAQNEVRILAGTIITPSVLTPLYGLILEKINTNAEFLDDDLRDALFIVKIKNNITGYEVRFNKYLIEIERNKKNEALVVAIHALIDDNKKALAALLEEGKTKRQTNIVIKEWDIVQPHLIDSLEKLVYFYFNTTLSNSRSLLLKFLPVCKYLPAEIHHCLKDHFSARISRFRSQMDELPLEILKRSHKLADLFDEEKEEVFGFCSEQRTAYASTERAEAEQLLKSGISIIESVKSAGKIDKALKAFASVQDIIVKKPKFDVSSSVLPCNVWGSLKKVQAIFRYIESTFSKGLDRLKNSFIFSNQMNPTESHFDFISVTPNIVSNGKKARIFDQICDLPSILSSLGPDIEELSLICFNTTAYGYTSTPLKVLLVETGYLHINIKGSTVRLTEPPSPPKSEPGQPGLIGLSGGTVLIKVHFAVKGGVLKIIGNGGDGGDGGDGLPGLKGEDGKNGVISPSLYDKSYYDSLSPNELNLIHTADRTCTRRRGGLNKYFKRDRKWICGQTRNYEQTFVHLSTGATPGATGMTGYSGQPGGAGGEPGELKLDTDISFRKYFIVLAQGGKGGKGGNGGFGGVGGRGGENKILEVTYTRVWEWKENQPDKMLSSTIGSGEKFTGRQDNGGLGEVGAKGKDGEDNKRKSQIQHLTVVGNSLFSIFEAINSFIAEKSERRYDGEKSVLRIIDYIENLVILMNQQKDALSTLRAHYTTQLIGMSLDSLIRSEMNLADALIVSYKNKQESLSTDFQSYIEALKSVDDLISQIKTGSLKYIVDKLRDKLLSEAQTGLAHGIQEVEEARKQTRGSIGAFFSKVFAVVNIISGFYGNPGAITGIRGLFDSTKDLFSLAKKNDLEGLKNTYDDIRSKLEDVQITINDVNTISEPKPPRSPTDMNAVFEDYFSLVNDTFDATESLSDYMENFIKDLDDIGIKSQIELGIEVSDLMKAYTPASFASSDVSNRFKRHEVRQLVSRLKSVLFEASTELGAQNIPDIDSLISAIDMKVELGEKLIKASSDISDIQLTIDGLKRRKSSLLQTSKTTVTNLASAQNALDNIVANSVLNLLSTGKQICSSLSDLTNIAAHIRQNNNFLSKMQPVSPTSSPVKFRTALNLLKNELNEWNSMQDGKIEIVLDAIDFPFEFVQLKTERRAVFPIFVEGKSNFWIESVHATLTNISTNGAYYTILLEHSGSHLFDFGNDLKLKPTVFESTYQTPGPQWKSVPKSAYNTVELTNYPLSSYYKIEIPENYKTLNIVSNVNINMSLVHQLVLIFKVWYEK
ncbi:uncharacterized protein LOC136034896 [Artemia franciscana]|uniref:uncharacterized protein LOC136034896 n=1 Tax=Artemia franciscana TaxID=6661 RepID=UPI0032DB50F5